MTTPADYPSSLVVSLWGGVRDDVQNNVVGADTAALAAAQGQAENAENGRRQLAARLPGHGAQIPMPPAPSGPAVGKYDAVGPPVGEGYAMTPAVVPAVSKSYGPDRPQYADDLTGGLGFTGGKSEPAISMWLGQRSVAAAGAVVVSPPRPTLWARLLRRVRR